MPKVRKKRRKTIRKRATIIEPTFLDRVMEKKKQVLIVSISLFLLLIVATGAYMSNRYLIREAEGRFNRALSVYKDTQKDGNYAPAFEAFKDAADVYKADDIKAMSYLFMGNIAFKQKRYKDAIGLYKQALSHSNEPNIRALALYNTGKSYEASDMDKEALKTFESLMDDDGAGFLKTTLSLEMALLYEKLGNQDKALKAYDTVINESDHSKIADWAMEKAMTIEDDEGR